MNKQLAIELLRRARELIEHRHQLGICRALIMVSANSDERAACDDVRVIIMERLKPSLTIDRWLQSNGPAWAKQELSRMRDDAFYDKLRATRLAWIDDLIRELS